MNMTLSTSSFVPPSGDARLLQRSLLYREWQAEREEILRHKWFESEKAGSDIGLENARVSWVIHHRARWLHARRAGRQVTQ